MFSALVGGMYSANINLLGSGIGPSRKEAAEELLRPVLKKRRLNGTLVLLIDEEYTLDRIPDVVRDFFNEAQTFAGKGHPLLVILPTLRTFHRG